MTLQVDIVVTGTAVFPATGRGWVYDRDEQFQRRSRTGHRQVQQQLL